eukprot:12927282-Prorocentrum_lima.AAC.1
MHILPEAGCATYCCTNCSVLLPIGSSNPLPGRPAMSSTKKIESPAKRAFIPLAIKAQRTLKCTFVMATTL